jgi:hypothetical protein
MPAFEFLRMQLRLEEFGKNYEIGGPHVDVVFENVKDETTGELAAYRLGADGTHPNAVRWDAETAADHRSASR